MKFKNLYFYQIISNLLHLNKEMEHLTNFIYLRDTPSSRQSRNGYSVTCQINRMMYSSRLVIFVCIAAFCFYGRAVLRDVNFPLELQSGLIVWANAQVYDNEDDSYEYPSSEIVEEENDLNLPNELFSEKKYPDELISIVQNAFAATDSFRATASNPLAQHVDSEEERKLEAVDAHMEDEEIVERLHTCYVAIYRHFDEYGKAYQDAAHNLVALTGMREDDIIRIATHNNWVACYHNLLEGDAEKIIANNLSQADDFRLMKRVESTPTRFSQRQAKNLETLIKVMQEKGKDGSKKPAGASRFFNLPAVGAFVIVLSLLYLGYHALKSTSTHRSRRAITKEEKRGKHKKHR